MYENTPVDPRVEAEINNQLGALDVHPRQMNNLLNRLAARHWRIRMPWNEGNTPQIEEEPKAASGAGVVITFREHGIRKILLAKAGTHYESPAYGADPAIPTYMIFGGMINMRHTEGSAFVPSKEGVPESAPQAAAREVEEELVDADNKPILTVDPNLLVPLDTKTLKLPFGLRTVTGFLLEAEPRQIPALKAHVERLENDTAYRHAVREHTRNPYSGKPEICTVSDMPLRDAAEGRVTLLHRDQVTLFHKTEQHYARMEQYARDSVYLG